MLFHSCDLHLYPTTLIYELVLDILKFLGQTFQKSDQDRQTDATERITMPHFQLPLMTVQKILMSYRLQIYPNPLTILCGAGISLLENYNYMYAD